MLSHYVYKGRLVRSYDLLRSLWRGVVGSDNGNIDVSRNKRVNRSSAKLASYLSKYIGKTFDQAEKHVNSYSASGRALPAPTMFQTVGTGSAVFELVLEPSALKWPHRSSIRLFWMVAGCTAAFPSRALKTALAATSARAMGCRGRRP